jgi:hypothetical protein
VVGAVSELTLTHFAICCVLQTVRKFDFQVPSLALSQLQLHLCFLGSDCDEVTSAQAAGQPSSAFVVLTLEVGEIALA